MHEDHTKHPHFLKHQRLIAAVCVAILAVLYLAGYAEWSQMTSAPQRAVAAARAGTFTPPFESAPLAFAPDTPPLRMQDGKAQTIYAVDTKQPVVFLTIDDGYYRDPEAAMKLREARVPATLFLTQQYVARAPGYFSGIAHESGSTIQNHTMNHKDLATLNKAEQRQEMCAASGIYDNVYGERPTLFRPPYGSFNDDVRRVSADCGMQGVVLWSALVEHGQMRYQFGDKLRPGDIVLMHFTPAFQQDLAAFVDAAKATGLQPQLLDDWVVPQQ